MFGRSVRTPLGKPVECIVDYDDFEDRDFEQKQLEKARFDTKYNTRVLPVLEPGDRVWVKAPSDPGAEGMVVRKHTTPESYWVKVGISEIRRNRKHLRLLEPENSLVTSSANAAVVDTGAERCGTDLVGSEPEVEGDLVPPSTEGTDASGLGLAGWTVTRSGRHSKKPQHPDYKYY